MAKMANKELTLNIQFVFKYFYLKEGCLFLSGERKMEIISFKSYRSGKILREHLI